MKHRSIVKAVIFGFITCGLYGIYWFMKLTDETHEAVGRETTATGGWAVIYTFITCGLYFFYWSYKMGESLTEAKEMRGMHSDGNDAIMYTIFSVAGFGIVTEALIQSSLNEIIAHDESRYPIEIESNNGLK